MPPNMTTIADVLNKANPPYKSHQIGKWHGGSESNNCLCLHALRVAHRVLTGSCAQCVRTYPSSRLRCAVTEAALEGTRA